MRKFLFKMAVVCFLLCGLTAFANAKPMTAEQGKKLSRIAEDVIYDLGLEKSQAQSLINNHGGVKKAIQQALKGLTPEKYANEEVKSDYGYPNGYAVKSIPEQIKIWKKYLPELSTDGVLKEAAYLYNNLPDGAEDLFVIPKWERVGSTYGKAVEKMLDIIAGNRSFSNFRKGRLGFDYLRLSERTAEYLEKLSRAQTGDFLVIPAQFGLKHRGRSVRRARAMFSDNEFGLGSFAVAAMLITHPEREQVWDQLHIYCAGDEYAPHTDGGWSVFSFFDFSNGQLRFATGRGNPGLSHYGSPSGFLPAVIDP